VLSVQDWAEIRRLRRSQRFRDFGDRAGLGISRNTVKAALASDGPPKYQRAAAGITQGANGVAAIDSTNGPTFPFANLATVA
jgi:hypothetical protein